MGNPVPTHLSGENSVHLVFAGISLKICPLNADLVLNIRVISVGILPTDSAGLFYEENSENH